MSKQASDTWYTEPLESTVLRSTAKSNAYTGFAAFNILISATDKYLTDMFEVTIDMAPSPPTANTDNANVHMSSEGMDTSPGKSAGFANRSAHNTNDVVSIWTTQTEIGYAKSAPSGIMTHLLKMLKVKENPIQHIAGMTECLKLLSESLGIFPGLVKKTTSAKYAMIAMNPHARNDLVWAGKATRDTSKG
jgi:hypothetical protein